MREVRQRKGTCMTILKKLDLYWLHANPTIKQTLIVYDAITRSKLRYGLENAPMKEAVKKSLNTCQLKGLRNILNIRMALQIENNTT